MTSILAALSMLATIAASPVAIVPEELRWVRPPKTEKVEVAWVLGEESKAEPYLLRVKFGAGARMPPHTHPDTRNTTVLAGTLYVGFGDVFDESAVVAVPTGAVYVAPAGVAHYVWAKDGDVVYQEAGVGPTAILPVKR
jgi:quercetin dioxygenase-like cupin family protein